MKVKKKAVPHPGEVLRRDYLDPLSLSGNALALALHIPATRISEILRGRRSITADTALRLERYWGNAKNGKSASEWMYLQTQYDLSLLMRTIGPRIEMEVRGRYDDRRSL